MEAVTEISAASKEELRIACANLSQEDSARLQKVLASMPEVSSKVSARYFLEFLPITYCEPRVCLRPF